MSRALTFGVEFEFLLAILPDGATDPFPDDPRPVSLLTTPIPNYAAIEDTRSERHFRTLAPVCQAVVNTLKASNTPAFPFFNRASSRWPASATDLLGWEVKWDISLRAPLLSRSDPRRVYQWVPMEVVSPVFFAVEESFEKVAFVCDLLTKRFRTNVNSSCGLHVHVGDGERGFRLEQLKTLMAALWCFEPQIQRLHPPERTKETAFYCRPLRPKGRIPGRKTLTGLEACAKIFGYEREEELIGWLNGGGSHAYKLENLIMRGSAGSKRTVEFRQHEGTLDPQRVVSWAKFCVRMLTWAGEVDASEVQKFLINELTKQQNREEGMDLLDFMVLLGLKKESQFYGEFLENKEEMMRIRKEAGEDEEDSGDEEEEQD